MLSSVGEADRQTAMELTLQVIIGFIGLAECLVALTGKHHGESPEAQALGISIVSHMRRRCDEAVEKYGLNFSLLATPAEQLSGKFTKLDLSQYGAIPGGYG